MCIINNEKIGHKFEKRQGEDYRKVRKKENCWVKTF